MNRDLKHNISNAGALVGGICLGAVGMYMLDPERGARRRALVRDKIVSGFRALGMNADKRLRDVGNRMRGSAAETRAVIRERNQQMEEDRLVERVRAQLGHVVAHPRALQVSVDEGCVIVSGPVLGGEAQKIKERLEETRGVGRFRIYVDEHASAEGIPDLQGESRGQRKERLGQA
jgi:hypothetical protein